MAKKPMTKIDIIEQMAKDAGITKSAAKAAMESLVVTCRKEVKAGRPFRVAGLGIFNLRKTKSRNGVNPGTGEKIKIKAKKRMAFKPGAKVKTMLNISK
jgi:DNA-binding protein HU-beta